MRVEVKDVDGTIAEVHTFRSDQNRANNTMTLAVAGRNGSASVPMTGDQIVQLVGDLAAFMRPVEITAAIRALTSQLDVVDGRR